MHDARYGFVDDPATSLQTALSIIESILEDDPSHTYTLGALGLNYQDYQAAGDLDLSVRTLERAVEVGPNDLTNHAVLGIVLQLLEGLRKRFKN